MIRRAPRPAGNFTVIRNEVLRDTRLSYRSRGVLAAILSRPDNWRTSALQLSREGAEGRDAVLTALNELETFGYLARRQVRLDDGTLDWEQIVYDSPTTAGLSGAGSPNSDSQAPLQQLIVTTDKKETSEPAVQQVYETWLASTGKSAERTKLDSRRLARIRWAISNYPLNDVLDAVVGWKNSDFHTGKNNRNKPYNDLTLLLRDSQHLEEMRDLARKGKNPGSAPKAWNKLQQMMEEEND